MLLYLFLGRLARFDSLHVIRLSSILSLSLSGSLSLSSEEGIHVPVPRTSVGPCRTPVLPPAPALSAWMSSYSAVWTALVSLFVAHVPKVCVHAPSLFITPRLYKWDEGGKGGYLGWEEPAERGEWGRQRPVSYNQALFCWAAGAS